MGKKQLAWILVFVFLLAPSEIFAADPIASWTKREERRDRFGSSVTIEVTYYAAEMVEALVLREAEKNLWTQSELENYKYQLLKTLEYEEYIPFRVDINNMGPSMHMAPFGRHVTLWLGNRKIEPVKYDPRFNFRLIGQRDGLIFFPRYDEKTNKPILDGVRTIRLEIDGAISPIVGSGSSFSFIWDITRDRPEALTSGRAAARLEMDRLLRRLELLNQRKREILSELEAVEAELKRIDQRMHELQTSF